MNPVTCVTGVNERMNENDTVLEEVWHYAEQIDDKGNYKLVKYRMIEQLSFYIRPAQEWFTPCIDCQKRLKKLLAEARWILGNKAYEPALELNNVKDEIDEQSFTDLKVRKATKEELDHIGMDGSEEIGSWEIQKVCAREGVKP